MFKGVFIDCLSPYWKSKLVIVFRKSIFIPSDIDAVWARGPHSHILMTGGPNDFFGSEILAKGDFFGSMKDARIFLGCEKKTEGFFGL